MRGSLLLGMALRCHRQQSKVIELSYLPCYTSWRRFLVGCYCYFHCLASASSTSTTTLLVPSRHNHLPIHQSYTTAGSIMTLRRRATTIVTGAAFTNNRGSGGCSYSRISGESLFQQQQIMARRRCRPSSAMRWQTNTPQRSLFRVFSNSLHQPSQQQQQQVRKMWLFPPHRYDDTHHGGFHNTNKFTPSLSTTMSLQCQKRFMAQKTPTHDENDNEILQQQQMKSTYQDGGVANESDKEGGDEEEEEIDSGDDSTDDSEGEEDDINNNDDFADESKDSMTAASIHTATTISSSSSASSPNSMTPSKNDDTDMNDKDDVDVDDNDIIRIKVFEWVRHVVIGLNLCPFAEKPWRDQQVHFHVIRGCDETQIWQQVLMFCLHHQTEPGTTLVICPECHPTDFQAYLQVLAVLEQEILPDHDSLVGQVQLASFHPLYEFSGSGPDGIDNWTNRAPYPIFHILREADVTKAVDKLGGHEHATKVWQRNIALMEHLQDEVGAEGVARFIQPNDREEKVKQDNDDKSLSMGELQQRVERVAQQHRFTVAKKPDDV